MPKFEQNRQVPPNQIVCKTGKSYRLFDSEGLYLRFSCLEILVIVGESGY